MDARGFGAMKFDAVGYEILKDLRQLNGVGENFG
jgi:hypothetical protein